MKYRSIYLLLPILVISSYTIRAAEAASSSSSSGGIVKEASMDSEETAIASLKKLQEAVDNSEIPKELALVIANNQFDSVVIQDQHKDNPNAHALVRSTNKVTQWTEDNKLYCPATEYRPAVVTRTKAPGALLNEIEDYPFQQAELYATQLKKVRAIPTSDTLLQQLEDNDGATQAGTMSFIGGQIVPANNKIREEVAPKVQLYITALHHQCKCLKRTQDDLKRIRETLSSDKHSLCSSDDFTLCIDALATWYNNYKMTDEEREQKLSTEQIVQKLFSQEELPIEIRALLHIYVQSTKNKPKPSFPTSLLSSFWPFTSKSKDAQDVHELLDITNQLVNHKQQYNQKT